MALIPNKSTVDPVSSSWANLLRDQTIQVTLSSARPSSPTEGMAIWETDTDRLMVYNGSAWYQLNGNDAWTAYTPTLSGSGTFNVNESKWCRRGRLVHVRLAMRFSTLPGSPLEIGLPVAAAVPSASFDLAAYLPIGLIAVADRSAIQGYFGVARLQSSTVIRIGSLASPTVDWAPVNINSPMPAWAGGAQGTGDELTGSLTYEPAA